MNELLMAMDDQMLKWVTELDELNRKKENIDKAIDELQQRINTLKKPAEYMKEGQE